MMDPSYQMEYYSWANIINNITLFVAALTIWGVYVANFPSSDTVSIYNLDRSIFVSDDIMYTPPVGTQPLTPCNEATAIELGMLQYCIMPSAYTLLDDLAGQSAQAQTNAITNQVGTSIIQSSSIVSAWKAGTRSTCQALQQVQGSSCPMLGG